MEEKKLRMFIGSKINELRREKKVTQSELGKEIGVKNNTISAYERGVISTDLDILFKLSEYLGVSINDFFPLDEDVDSASGSEYTYFPTAISAGLPLEVDGITESSKISVSDELLGKWSSNRNIFFAHINGDSMNRLMADGSLIAIKPINSTGDLKNGDIVVYSVDGEYSVKHYYKYSDTLVFKPNSTIEHEEHTYNAKEDNIRIHGVVVTYVINRD